MNMHIWMTNLFQSLLSGYELDTLNKQSIVLAIEALINHIERERIFGLWMYDDGALCHVNLFISYTNRISDLSRTSITGPSTKRIIYSSVSQERIIHNQSLP